ncbi:rhodopsin, GQ-coupled-like [Branchiostoma floridae]|uniref:Rhodopsin, GQ-coupled-like n=1 Tax=Branchiostoma floridae TaxID=7739 RepID=A0A9J7N1M5_BRAFL|nr:rhodopsin, GQ-coupled-like [Branchiostoma floridae]
MDFFLDNSSNSFPVLCNKVMLTGNESVSGDGNLTGCIVGEHFCTSQIVNATLILLFGVTGAVGNTLALYAFIRALRKPKNYLVANLCLSQLLMCLAYSPVTAVSNYLHRWVGGYIGCQVVGFLTGTACMVSILSITAIARQRLGVVRAPLHSLTAFTHSTELKRLALIWLISIVSILPPLTGWNRFVVDPIQFSATMDYLSTDTPSKAYIIALMVFGFFIPLADICYCYSYILYTVVKLGRGKLIRKSTKKGVNEISIALGALMITSLFCVCWFPYMVVVILGMSEAYIPPELAMAASPLAKLSTTINSILFALSLPAFRRHFFPSKKVYRPSATAMKTYDRSKKTWNS